MYDTKALRPVRGCSATSFNLLEREFARTVTLDELARRAGINKYHLVREFRRSFGMPPYRYLELVRVMLARKLLREGMRLADAAFTAGFCDRSRFTRRFKSVPGVPPGRYSRSYAKAHVRGTTASPRRPTSF